MGDVIRVLLFVALAAGVIWVIVRETQREHERQELAKKNMSFIESINLTGLPIITFHNNGHPINMVLDTGSNVCLINSNILSDLKYESGEKHTGVIGLNGESEAGNTVFLPLTYKDWEFDFECWATDIGDMVSTMKREYGVTIHGLLGTGFFQKYKYVIDFNEMVAYSLKKD